MPIRPPTKDERTHPGSAYRYARDVLNGRFPAGEKAIATSSKHACDYAIDVLKGRFPAGEKIISDYEQDSWLYAKYVIKGRWPPGEEAIMGGPEFYGPYLEFLAEEHPEDYDAFKMEHGAWQPDAPVQPEYYDPDDMDEAAMVEAALTKARAGC